MSILGAITGADRRRAREDALRTRRRARFLRTQYRNAIDAGRSGGRGSWQGIQSTGDEDRLNKEYLTNLGEVLQRAQDLDVNNPDIHGFHRTRTAQVIGRQIHFEFAPDPAEIGMTADTLAPVVKQVNRLREIHSRLGGFDSTGLGRSEGKQMERAFLTALVTGCCLIHRVWKRAAGKLLPLSLELIPGTRISTPYEKLGDPLVSYGVQYTDNHRTEVVGFWVRRVSMTVGNSFVPDFKWDLLPIEDCSLMMLTEIAGLDRSMPLALPVVRMMRNRGEFIEAAVKAARVQTKTHSVQTCSKDGNPLDEVADATTWQGQSGESYPVGIIDLGEGISREYIAHDEKVELQTAKLPGPDFKDFMDATDERCARGFVTSKSRFTRTVSSSYAGGRMEEQQDKPVVEQLRDIVVSAWGKVNRWLLECCWITGAVDIPNYSAATIPFWCNFHATPPPEYHINPVDTSKSRQMDLMARIGDVDAYCRQDGTTLEHNLRAAARATKLALAIEKEFELPAGSLDVLIAGRVISTSAGAEIGGEKPVNVPDEPGEPSQETDDGADGGEGGGEKGNRIAAIERAARRGRARFNLVAK